MARIRGCDLTVVQGDITAQATDAIVNAANSSLLGGGGVDGAIHAVAGPTLLEECREIRRTVWPDGLPAGRSVITRGGRLHAKFVIHTVGPVWHGGDQGEATTLKNAYTSALRLATSRGLRSIAFPSISTGAYGYPMRDASLVAIGAVRDFLGSSGPEGSAPEHRWHEVRFVLFSRNDLAEFHAAWNEVWGPPSDTLPESGPAGDFASRR